MTALNTYEKRTIVIAIVAILIFILTRLLHHTISFIYDHSYYLISHTLFELFSIFVCYSIFLHGWLTFHHTHSRKKLNLSLIFFAIGSIDLFHAIAYQGMPFFQSGYSVNIATWFWIVGRFIESMGLLFFILKFKDQDQEISEKKKNSFIFITLFLVFVVIYSVLSFPQYFPVLFKEGEGATSLKIILEYIIIMIRFITIIFIVKYYIEAHDKNFLTLSLGVILLLVGEMIFTLYQNVYDIDNLLGHTYKVFGYFFLLRGIYFPQFRRIMEDREQAELRRLMAEERLKEQENKVTTRILKAQEEERMRVSRHLHDGVGQALYSILVSLRMLKQVGVDEHIVKQLENIERLTSHSMDEVKSLAFQLRPSSLDDLGLLSAIRSHIQRYETTYGIKVDLEIIGKKQRYSQEIETELYRIFQEALNNAAKYSETAKVIVRIINNPYMVELQIIDEGKGFNLNEYNAANSEKGIGLYSMRERASLIKGTFEIESIENVGTKIRVSIPLPKNIDEKL